MSSQIKVLIEEMSFVFVNTDAFNWLKYKRKTFVKTFKYC